jgi:sialic acid synthase SpsE
MADKVKLGRRWVGKGEPPYIVAEIGANHNGNMGLARELIAAAKDCGCDAVKFQLWDRYVGHTESYIRQLSELEKLGDVELRNPEIGLMTVADQLETFQCTRDQHIELKAYADSVGIDFGSTTVTEPDIDFLVELNVAFLKIASMHMNHPAFIRYIAQQNMPTIMSTGMASWSEIGDALNCFKPDYLHNLVVLHCIAIYPPPSDSMLNLAKMETLRQISGVPVGFSDHTLGFSIPLAAVARGAVVIEKHFTLDKKMPGWDHKVSADPEEMRIICREGRRVFESIGEPNPDLSPEEIKKRDHFRTSIVSTQRIPKGDVITLEKIFFKRPGTGIEPNEMKYVLNRIAKNDIQADELIHWEDLF